MKSNAKSAIYFHFLFIWVLSYEFSYSAVFNQGETNKSRIYMAEKVDIFGDSIYLENLIKKCDSSAGECDAIKSLLLKPSPKIGSKLRIYLSEVDEWLSNSGYSIEIISPLNQKSILVNRPAKRLSSKDVFEHLKIEMNKEFSYFNPNTKIKISQFFLLNRIKIEDKPYEIKFPIVYELDRDFFSGKKNISVYIRQQGVSSVFEYKAVAIFKKLEPFVVFKKSYIKGNLIKESDIEIVYLDKLNSMNRYLNSKEYVINKMIKSSFPKGKVILKNHLIDPSGVEKNKWINARVIQGNMNITVEAKTMVSGSVGDLISVRLKSNQKVVKAKVLSSKMVEILL